MPKLHLKRTRAEETEHEWRKHQKAARKAKRSLKAGHSDNSVPVDGYEDHITGSRKRHRPQMSGSDSGNDQTEHGYNAPQSPTNSPFSPHKFKPDFDAILAQLEEDRFRDKLFGAYEDDERLHSLEARLNDFAHVPQRWRVQSETAGDEEEIDPQYMSDESYAEWVRTGMWRRTHAAEFEEQRRRRALKDARRAQKVAAKAETARLEKAAQEVQLLKKREMESRRWEDAREVYDRRWKYLIGGDVAGETDLRFEDVPWPVIPVGPKSSRKSRRADVTVEDLTELAISAFLLPPSSESGDRGRSWMEKKERKERLRETMLRFHPDKFEGRLLRRVKEEDQERVRDGVGQVVRVLNGLMVKEHDV